MMTLSVAAILSASHSYARDLPAHFVGCASDGQVGPRRAPRSGAVPLVPAALASQVAYYASAGGPGVLAPMGWHCFGLYGSSGSTLLVTPETHSAKELFGERRFKTHGPAVEISYEYGGTSGRWAVANAIARYFPDQRGFIGDKNFQGLDVALLPTGPFPSDVMRSRTANSVRLVTPPDVEGMGTSGLLSPADDPVQGMVELISTSDGPDLLTSNARLPRNLTKLWPVIARKALFHLPR